MFDNRCGGGDCSSGRFSNLGHGSPFPANHGMNQALDGLERLERFVQLIRSPNPPQVVRFSNFGFDAWALAKPEPRSSSQEEAAAKKQEEERLLSSFLEGVGVALRRGCEDILSKKKRQEFAYDVGGTLAEGGPSFGAFLQGLHRGASVQRGTLDITRAAVEGGWALGAHLKRQQLGSVNRECGW